MIRFPLLFQLSPHEPATMFLYETQYMIRSLCRVIGLGCFGLIVLFVFSDKATSSFGSFATQQIAVYEKEKVLIYGATKYFGSPMFDSNAVKSLCSKDTAVG